ncbi:hypothetical protein [Azotobacter vinelandii]|uniref:hypothetical protein n=1 Tax=Azotobacter vinelandii TaxID=354 RepID=UPI002666E83F|nr:hypothetical protein [Azotobacter vinelandii]WKN20242.1 hypothetical protein AVAEIV_003186 [Azotobacter vinelandii]
MNSPLRYALTVAAILGTLALIVLSRLPMLPAPAAEPQATLGRPHIEAVRAGQNLPG